MAYPHFTGEDQKYRVTTSFDLFSLADYPFTIVIKNRWGQIRYVIKKEKCFKDTDGNYYFTMENVLNGTYFAYFRGSMEDEDYNKQTRTLTDVQQLCVVPSCYDEYRNGKHCCCQHKVHYERVYTASIDGNDYLCDCDGNYIYTSDGKRIQFTKPGEENTPNNNSDMKIQMKMTGDQFLQFMEGTNPDGQIDTIPEMMRAAQGISDTETIQEDVNQQIDENMQDKSAESSDIDEIFNQ